MEVRIEPEQAGMRLDQLVAELLPDCSRSAAQKLAEQGNLLVNGQAAAKNCRLKAGDLLEIHQPEPELLDVQPENLPLPILYEDDHLLVVNKPKGMVVHPAPGNYTGTMVNALLYHCQGRLSSINGVIRPGIVHRIDKDTSGLLIVAKTDRAHQGLAEQIKVHSFDRVYETVVYGNVREDSGTIRNFLGRHPVDRKKMAVLSPDAPGAREAITHFRVLARYDGFTHLECRLETGRTHQIRVHMVSIGHPVAGDPVYGPKKVLGFLNGQCLHAKSIGFIHPITGERMDFDSPLPEYFTAFLRKLQMSSPTGRQPLEGRLLAVDCDGTLLRGDKTISQENLDAVRRFRSLGGAFALATGRSIPTASDYLDQLDIQMPVILYNGAMIYDPVDRRPLWMATLPEETKTLVERVVAQFPSVGAEVLTGEERLYAVAWNDLIEAHLCGTYPVPHQRCKPDDVMHLPWIKLLFAIHEDEMPALIDWVEQQHLPGVRTVHSDRELFEVLPQAAGKGNALRRLCDLTGFSLEATAAMGDYYNDLEMVQLAGLGAAPENACEAVRDVAAIVTPSNEENGVAWLVDYLIQHPGF